MLEKQIQRIKEATEAADNLPVTLESLKKASNKVDNFSTESATLFGKIDTFLKSSEANTQDIIKKKNEADQIVAQCHEAYRIATSTGLAGVFDQRAKKLSSTMYW